VKCRGLISTLGLPTWRRCTLVHAASDSWWAWE